MANHSWPPCDACSRRGIPRLMSPLDARSPGPIRGCLILVSHEDADAKQVTVLGAETSGTTGTGTALANVTTHAGAQGGALSIGRTQGHSSWFLDKNFGVLDFFLPRGVIEHMGLQRSALGNSNGQLWDEPDLDFNGHLWETYGTHVPRAPQRGPSYLPKYYVDMDHRWILLEQRFLTISWLPIPNPFRT